MEKISLIETDFIRKSNGIIWEKNVPKTIKFKINSTGEEDEIELIGYNKSKSLVMLKYDEDEPFEIEGHALIKGWFFVKVNHFKKGSIIDTEKGKLKVLECIRKKKNTYTEWFYKYECLVCGNIDEISHGNLKAKYGCNVCGNKKVKSDYNSLGAINPSLIKYFKNEEEAFYYSYQSNKKVELVCPDCHTPNSMIINNLYNRGFYCKSCGDGVSYPNKLMFNILLDLNINFDSEKVFDWSDKKKYDFYIPSENLVIEMHGGQHYRYTGRGRSLEEEMENDLIKKELAEKNGLKYIDINSSETDLFFIKNNLYESKLSSILNLDDVDWDKVSVRSEKSIMVEVCKAWSTYKSTKDMALFFKVSRNTITKYLKRGNKLGLCDYNLYYK